jgi:uncharacterized protein (TIGR02246 family)
MMRVISVPIVLSLLLTGGADLLSQERSAPAPAQRKKPAPAAAPKTDAAPSAPKPAAAPNAAPAADAGSAPVRPQDEQAIRAASQAFAKAFATGDANAVAALFTEEAEYMDEESEPIHGRAALLKAYEAFFAARKDVKTESETDTIRFLGTDTAVETGTFTVTAGGEAPNSSRYSALYVRQGGKWLIALLKEWGADEETASAPNLQDLSWLIGTWETDNEEVTASTSYEWTANQSFIRVQYTITPKKTGEKPSSGVQVIGVDPAVGYIRAWLFASDGGIGESTWAWDGTRWMIESVGTLADGSATTAINFLSRGGDDEFSWRSVQRTLAGEALPDIGPVTVKRVGKTEPAPAAKAAKP